MYQNTTFDADFLKIKDLKWLPWIGKDYEKTRTIILGESQYEDGDEWQEGNINATRTLIDKRFTGSKGKIYTNVEKVLLKKENVIQKEGNKVWQSVSYCNLVTRLMSSIEERPTDLDKDKGWKVFLDIAEIIKPHYCIVLCQTSGRLGYYLNNTTTCWNRNIPEFYAKEKVINLTSKSDNLRLIFINHPSGSRGFNWSRWSELVHRSAPYLYDLISE